MKAFVDRFQPISFPIHGVRLPTFEISQELRNRHNIPEDSDNYQALVLLCRNGFRQKLNFPSDSPEYKTYHDRVKYELETIKDLGFIDYILLVWFVIDFCHQKNIPIGLGRGSAAGSLVLYLIGVTRVDPIKYSLFFERFISRIRAKKKVVDGITYLDGSLMVDIDMDICYYRRPEVLAFLEERFKGRTSKIGTFSTLSGKLLIKECSKIIDEISESDANEVAEMIPKDHGHVRDIGKTYYGIHAEDGTEKEPPKKNFVEWVAKHPDVFEVAMKLRDLNKNKGVHPSGILLSFNAIEDTCPLELSQEKGLVSSFDMEWVSLFSVKLDVLGLRGVSVVDDVCKSIGIKVEDIDINDPLIYQSLFDLKAPHGIFQIEAETNFRVCQKVKPKNLDELSAILALARPGALQFVEQYATFTNTGVYNSLHPLFEDVLKSTGGVVLYQEQLMKMANKIGFTLDEAEVIRKVVGKKKVKEMAEWEEKIKKKVIENNLPKETGDILWQVMDAAKDYSFNRSHSIAYAYLAAITVYLKFKYPLQFFLSLLKMAKHEPAPIQEIRKIKQEMNYHFNISLLPPHLLHSDIDFKIEGNSIRAGLLSVKGVSDKQVEKLQGFKQPFSNKFQVFQGAKDAGLPIGVLSALIQAGALEGFKQSRSLLVLEAQLWNILTEKERILCFERGAEFDFDLNKTILALSKAVNEKGKPLIKPTRLETIRKKFEPYKQIYFQNSKHQGFCNWYYERSLLGYSHSTSLKEVFSSAYGGLKSLSEFDNLCKNEQILCVGVIENVKEGTAKNEKKTKWARFIVSDETASVNVLLFNEHITLCKELNGDLPKEENIVIIKGSRFNSAISAQSMKVQDQKIFMRLKELKSSKTEEITEESKANK